MMPEHIEQMTRAPGEVRDVVIPIWDIQFSDDELAAIGRAVVEVMRALHG
jgi:hypothetical protein